MRMATIFFAVWICIKANCFVFQISRFSCQRRNNYVRFTMFNMQQIEIGKKFITKSFVWHLFRKRMIKAISQQDIEHIIWCNRDASELGCHDRIRGNLKDDRNRTLRLSMVREQCDYYMQIPWNVNWDHNRFFIGTLIEYCYSIFFISIRWLSLNFPNSSSTHTNMRCTCIDSNILIAGNISVRAIYTNSIFSLFVVVVDSFSELKANEFAFELWWDFLLLDTHWLHFV